MSRCALLTIVAMIGLFSPLRAQQQQEKTDAVEEKEYGKRVGEQAPDFSLVDQRGSEQSLQLLLDKGPVAIIFYRSSDW